ncbi:hypothetical protein SAMN04489832_5313 [Micromonospora cremea]|uniref:Uncharacterized protein n=1 Tax=Micromonospora cremea TaxID=709881 RepID=A0A1N6AD17_9ACTN|nr:hypothetical protein SAMN04489832_5313 [Micromonospora cremea]
MALRQCGEQFGDQTALADAGLTLQQDHARRSLDEPAQQFQLRRPPDELDRTAQACGADGGWTPAAPRLVLAAVDHRGASRSPPRRPATGRRTDGDPGHTAATPAGGTVRIGR